MERTRLHVAVGPGLARAFFTFVEEMVNGRTTEDELQWITTPIQQSWKKYVKENKLDMELNCVINKVTTLH